MRVLHVDEVDDDQAAEVAQTHLAGRFIGGLEVGAQRGLLDVATFGGARRVDVDRDQRLGVVDHDRTARRQRHDARIRGLDLVFDLEAGEQRDVVAVALDPDHVVGHHVRHELPSLFADVVGVDQDLADVRREVVADRADHQARFLVDQERAAGRLRCAVDRAPQLQQVVQVPLQFFGIAADAGGARDHAHPGRDLELVHRLAQFLPVLALDAARDAAAARVVRHQHQVAAGKRDEGRQRCALVAALFLVDLDDDFLAFLERVLDPGATDVGAGLEERLGDLLEGQKAVTFLAVVDEARLEARLDAGDDPFVDVALAGLVTSRLDVDVDQLLAVDDGDPQFFRVGRIEQHPLHSFSSMAPKARRAPAGGTCPGEGRTAVPRRPKR